jgi:REP element-mobilizing transposase RayT
MAAPPRFIPPGYPVLISSRMQEGLPLVCTLFMELIIRGILARAQTLFPFPICAFVFMGNHFHLLVICKDPLLLVNFVDHIKTELAHAVNKFLGRRRHTVWCEGFAAEPILTRADVVNKLTYLYCNPQTANLVETIEQYPGVSSWEMFSEDSLSFTAPWINRPQIERLIHPSVSASEDLRLTEELRRGAKEDHTFTLEPYAWVECFGEGSRNLSEVKKEIIDSIRQCEEKLRLERKYPCVGASRLRRQPIDLKYTPTKYSKRMWCICHDVELRKAFILWAKELVAKGREVLRRWREGDRTVHYPPGLFPPSFPKLANVLPNEAFQKI